MIPLRPYQTKLFNEIHEAWGGGARNVCAVSATGSGKSLLAAHVVAAHRGASCVIAHRQELVGQLAMALARCGVEHSIVAPPATVRNIVQMELREVGRSFYNPLAPCRVAGVNTLVRVDPSTAWLKQTTLWVQDECHHITVGSTWHRAAELLPNAKGLGVTATPLRSDGKGLGRHADGVFDALVCGPSMRSLIEAGYLTDYDIYCPPMTVDLSQVGISASGDYSPGPLSQAMRKSSITGDVVGHYLKVASGKLGVTFAVDIEAATEITEAYRSRGVPAELVTGKTPDLLRSQILRRLRNREVLQLVNVDLFGEGFDLPAIEAVSFARPTLSYGLYVQQFGRGLRPLPGKGRAIIIDHVGNVLRHALPDRPRVWSLDRREKRAAAPSDAIPLRACPQCTKVYERTEVQCPYCGHVPVPAGRSRPEEVDGDLHMLTPEVLAAMRTVVAKVDGAPAIPYGAAPEVVGAVRKRHAARQEAQAALRHAMAVWGGASDRVGRERQAQKEFYLRFGVDVLGAQALGAREAAELGERVQSDR